MNKLSKPESIREAVTNANPNLGDKVYRNNCTACSITTFIRTLGFDVVAKDTQGKPHILSGMIEECFKGAKILDGSAVKFGRSQKDVSEMLVKRFGYNASGVVSVPLKGGGGHAFNWEIKNGVVKFFDGQQQRCDDEFIKSYWNRMDTNGALTLARLDNTGINFDAIKKYVKNR